MHWGHKRDAIFFENLGNEKDNSSTVPTYGHGYYTKGKDKKELEPALPTANGRWCKSEESKKIRDRQLLNQSPINLPPQIQDFSISSTNVIQWNNQGISNKKVEIIDIKLKKN